MLLFIIDKSCSVLTELCIPKSSKSFLTLEVCRYPGISQFQAAPKNIPRVKLTSLKPSRSFRRLFPECFFVLDSTSSTYAPRSQACSPLALSGVCVNGRLPPATNYSNMRRAHSIHRRPKVFCVPLQPKKNHSEVLQLELTKATSVNSDAGSGCTGAWQGGKWGGGVKSSTARG